LQQQLDLLKQKAQICSNIENNNITSDNIDWRDLAKLKNNALEKKIELRHEQANELAEQQYSEDLLTTLLEQSYNEKEKLCLSLEIKTDQKSPENETQKRMEFQIQQINDNTKDIPQTIEEIVEQWYLLCNFEQHKELNERFANLL